MVMEAMKMEHKIALASSDGKVESIHFKEGDWFCTDDYGQSSVTKSRIRAEMMAALMTISCVTAESLGFGE